MAAKIVAGKLWAWKVREFCKDAEYLGYDIEWEEDSGWLSSTFYISGDEDHVDDLYGQIMNLRKSLD